MKNFLVSMLLIIAGLPLFGQNSPDEIIAEFFGTYQKDRGKAVKNLYKESKWMERREDDVLDVVSGVEKFTPDFVGEYHGFVPITEKQLSDCLVLKSYLLKYERQPVRFTFKFYKPDKKWTVFSFAYDYDLDDELSQAAVLYYLPLD